MIDRPEDTNPRAGADDALRRALLDEVPAPGDGYWAAIDARLAATATEATDSAAAPVIHLHHSSDGSDTDAAVIRPTDMNTTTPTSAAHPSRHLPLALAAAAAAAAALILGVVGFSVLRDQAATPVESTATVDGSAGAGDAPDANVDADATDPANPVPSEGTLEPASDDPDPRERTWNQTGIAQRCYFEQYLPEEDPDPSVVWVVEIDGNDFRALLEFPGGDGEVTSSFDTGTIDADGLGQSDSGAIVRFSDGGGERAMGEAEPFTATEVDCSSIADADERFARLADGPTRTAVPGAPAIVDEPDAADTPADTAPPADIEIPFEETLIGLTEEAAARAVEDAGYLWRVVRRDGEDLPATKDYRLDRISAAIQNGVVIEASFG